MRLIDADKLMDALRGNVLVDVTPEIKNTVQEQTTAYDVDKVVEQLSERQYEDELHPCSLVVDFEEAEKIVRAGGLMKYRCIKELCLPKYDGDGLLIPNEFFGVEVGSEWQQDTRTNICGGDIHLDRIEEGQSEWIEISWETLDEAFKLIKVSEVKQNEI